MVKEYDKFHSSTDKLYGVHSHKDRSIMSHNGVGVGDIPHVARNNLSQGLFMINQEGNVFFVNKVLATVFDKYGPNYAIKNQVYLGTIE